MTKDEFIRQIEDVADSDTTLGNIVNALNAVVKEYRRDRELAENSETLRQTIKEIVQEEMANQQPVFRYPIGDVMKGNVLGSTPYGQKCDHNYITQLKCSKCGQEPPDGYMGLAQ